MQNLSEITISIHLLSGDPIVFKIEADEDRQRNAGTRIERSMDANYIGVELGEKLVVIPTNNIQKVEISPAPAAMISHIVMIIKKAQVWKSTNFDAGLYDITGFWWALIISIYLQFSEFG